MSFQCKTFKIPNTIPNPQISIKQINFQGPPFLFTRPTAGCRRPGEQERDDYVARRKRYCYSGRFAWAVVGDVSGSVWRVLGGSSSGSGGSPGIPRGLLGGPGRILGGPRGEARCVRRAMANQSRFWERFGRPWGPKCRHGGGQRTPKGFQGGAKYEQNGDPTRIETGLRC